MAGKPTDVLKGKTSVDLLKQLRKQREEASLCDVILVVKSQEFLAHRCVLASSSPYFQAMFSSDFKEKTQQRIDMSEAFSSPESVQKVLDFIYGGEIVITDSNIEDYLKCSSLFQIADLNLMCFNFLVNSLTVGNCLQYWIWAKLYDIITLDELCRSLATSAFPGALIQASQTLDVPPLYIKQFLNDGLASLCSETLLQSFIDRYCALHVDASDIRSQAGDFSSDWRLNDVNVQKGIGSSEDQSHTEPIEEVRSKSTKTKTGSNEMKVDQARDRKGRDQQSNSHKSLRGKKKNQKVPVEDNYKKLLVWRIGEEEFGLYSLPDNRWFVLNVARAAKRSLRYAVGLTFIGFSSSYSEEPVAIFTNYEPVSCNFDIDHAEEGIYYGSFMVGLKTGDSKVFPKIRLLNEEKRDIAEFASDQAELTIGSETFFCANEQFYAISQIKVREPGMSEEESSSDDAAEEFRYVKVVLSKLNRETMNWVRVATLVVDSWTEEMHCSVGQLDDLTCHIVVYTGRDVYIRCFDALNETLRYDFSPVTIPEDMRKSAGHKLSVRSFDGKIVIVADSCIFQECIERKAEWQNDASKWDEGLDMDGIKNEMTSKESALGFQKKSYQCSYAEPGAKYCMARKFFNLHHMIKVSPEEDVTRVSPPLFTQVKEYDYLIDLLGSPKIVYASRSVINHLPEESVGGRSYLEKTILIPPEKEAAFARHKENIEKYSGHSGKKYDSGKYVDEGEDDDESDGLPDYVIWKQNKTRR